MASFWAHNVAGGLMLCRRLIDDLVRSVPLTADLGAYSRFDGRLRLFDSSQP
jgi:hypothetical protein